MNNGSNKDKNPLSAYIIVTHIAFVVAVPLLLFIGGGVWLVDRLSWNESLKIVFVLLGIAVMAASLISYLRHLIAEYGSGDEPPALKPSNRERDYYED
jgi:hypothetical protein